MTSLTPAARAGGDRLLLAAALRPHGGVVTSDLRGTVPMRLVHRGIETRAGRAVVARVLGTRVAPSGWDPVPEPPDALARRIAPVPLPVVRGDADPCFPIDHGRWLAAAAGPPARRREVPGSGHAETSVGAAPVGRIGRWARDVTARVGNPQDGDGRPGPSARMPA